MEQEGQFNSNKHIEEYLNYYFELHEPDFAVLLTGEWGSGKTWFINKITEEYSTRIGKNKNDIFLFISLYGMTDTSEIDKNIFEKLHPVISARPVKFIGNIINGALKLGFKFNLDINQDGKQESETSVNSDGLLKIFDLFTIKTDKIIVFDDIERCFINPQRLFGYINSFVEHQRSNVILISHEEELFEKHDNKTNKESGNTKRFKEKTIGATFKVESCVDEAFTSFIELVEEYERNILNDHRDLILSIYHKLDYRNLRNLKQAIQNFPFFYKQFPDGLLLFELENSLEYFVNGKRSNYRYLESTIEMYFYLKLESSQGTISNETWIEAKKVFNKTGDNYTKYSQNKSEGDKNKTDLLFYTLTSHDLLGQYWYDAVVENKSYKHFLDDKFIELKKVQSERNRPLWRMLNQIISMSEEELQTNYENLLRDFKDLNYTHPGEILHITGLLLLLSKHGIIPLKNQDIKSMIIETIERLTQKGIIEHYQTIIGFHGAYGGYMFSENEDPIFKDIYEFIKINNQKISEKSKIDEMKNDLAELAQNFTNFCNELRYIGYNGKYADFPALIHIENRDEFFNYLIDVRSKNLSIFLHFLMERYEIKYGNGQIRPIFKDEFIFLTQLKDYIESRLSSNSKLYNISSFKFEQDRKDLELIISRFSEAFPVSD